MTRESFDEWLARLRQGDAAAAREVCERYTRRLVALASLRMNEAIKTKEDPEDVVQSVYRSFFVRHAAGQFTLDSEENLWSVLAQMTVFKCCHRAEKYSAAKRDVRREQAGEQAGEPWQVMDRSPTPDEVVLLSDLVERLMRALPPDDRRVLELRLQGYAVKEIATETGRAERSVSQAISTIREKVQRLVA